MARLSQSLLFPAPAADWLGLLSQSSRAVALASQAPTLTLRFSEGVSPLEMPHELVNGLFRVSWSARIETLDLVGGRVVASLAGGLFESFRHEISWTEVAEGLSIRSELDWSAARASLDEILERALLRFPQPIGVVLREGQRDTGRLVHGRLSA